MKMNVLAILRLVLDDIEVYGGATEGSWGALRSTAGRTPGLDSHLPLR